MDTELISRQIQLLDAVRFVQLCTDLLTETAAMHGIPRCCLTSNLRITDPDGGIDARCVAAPITVGRLIPRSDNAYQFKSGHKRAAAAVAREDILQKPRVMETLCSGGAFVYMMGWDVGDGFEEQVAAAVRSGEGQHATFAVENSQVICIGSYVLAELLREVPALVSRLIGAGDATLYDIKQWRAMRRFQNPFQRDSRLDAFIDELCTRIAAPRATVHVIGAAGDGKTRTVLEALAASELAPSVLYAPEPDAMTPAFLHYLAHTPEVRCTVIVDEVDDHTAQQFADQFGMMPDGVRLVTIGANASGRAGRHTVALDDLDEDTLIRVIQTIATGVDAEAACSIARLTERSPKLAVLLAERVRDDPTLAVAHRLLHDPDVWTGLECYLAIGENDPAWQALAALSLLNHVGWSGDADYESEILFGALGLDAATARRHVEALHERYGIAPIAGRFRYTSPQLLADYLAVRQLGAWTRTNVRAFLDAIGPHLAERFARRLRRLAGVLRNRNTVEQAIFDVAGPFDAIEQVEGTPLAVLLRHLAAAFPWPALRALERMMGSATDDALRAVTLSRRDLVWALESLLWRADTFERAAALLIRLAIAENEPSIGNNATGIFVETFQTQLGRTAAGPIPRFRVLRAAAEHASPTARVLAAKALAAALRTGHVSRLGMPPRDVDEMPEEAWRPKTYGEWFDVARQALARLAPLLTDASQQVRDAAVKALADSVPTAVYLPVTDEWLAAAESLVRAPYDLRAPVVRAILWEVRRRRSRDEVGKEVDTILGITRDPGELCEMEEDADQADADQEDETAGAMPVREEERSFESRVLDMARFAVRVRGDDFPSRLRRAVTRDLYAVGVHGMETEVDRARKELERLAAEGLAFPVLVDAEWPWMIEAHRDHAWMWADVLGEVDRDRQAVPGLERIAPESARGSMLLALYEIAYARVSEDNAWVDHRAEALFASGAPAVAFDLLYRAGYTANRVGPMAALLAQRGLRDDAIATLAFPPWGNEMPPVDASRLLEAAKDAGASPAAAISFASYYLHYHPEARGALRELALHFLLLPGGEAAQPHDEYAWSRVAAAYAEESPAEVMKATLAYVAAQGHTQNSDVADVLRRVWNASDRERLFFEVIEPWLDADTVQAWRVRDALVHLPIQEIGVGPLRDWVGTSPKARAITIAKILGPPHAPVSDAHAVLLTDFSDYGVDDAFFGALVSGSFWGSIVERTRGLIERVRPMLGDSRPAVVEWASHTIHRLEEMAKRDQGLEDEEGLLFG